MIKVENLGFEYPNVRALNNVSFEIKPGTITALVGPNGAGKTTLLRCLAALLAPMYGEITIDGWDAITNPRKVHQISSYLSDFFGLYDELTVKQCLTFMAMSHNCPTGTITDLVRETAKTLDIQDLLDKDAGKLSRGQRQRLAIAQTIIHKPKILFLDEPASGLDPEARFHLSELLVKLKNDGITLIVSSHILSELEDYSTHMLVIQKGKLVKHCPIMADKATSQTEKLLEVNFSSDPTSYKQKLDAIENIEVYKVLSDKIIIKFTGDATAQHELLKNLIQNNLPVCGISEHKQKMQDVYLDITKTTGKED